MKKIALTVVLAFSVALLAAWLPQKEKPVRIPRSVQRTGDPQAGFEYLTTGNYVRSGLPLTLFMMGAGQDKHNFLNRSGYNKNINHGFTAVKAANGEVVVAPNCLQCHAQVYDGKLVMGLGNAAIDFSTPDMLNAKNLTALEQMLQRFPKQLEAAAPFIRTSKALAPYLIADVRGVNLADHLAGLLAAHRDPVTFKWNDSSAMKAYPYTIPTDTPPWWLLKKKNAMFYNGFGRGDFGRFLMASNLLTVNDTSESRQVDEHMPDVLAYIFSLEAPKYTGSIDEDMAKQGKKVFEKSCSGCHGTYGRKEKYPNLLIPEKIIGTDSFLYSANYSDPQFVNWFNRSWFTRGDHPAQLVPFRGYIAPPLDGIWITAPYLHNGSVPTLDALLNSSSRPRYWTRDFDNPKYDGEKGGWEYTELKAPNGKKAYNTDLPGYGNGGHVFGDHLDDKKRRAVIEYLKTL